MTLINLRDIKAEETIRDGARAAIQTYPAKPDERVRPITDPIYQRRILDVDAVLARSLRSVSADEL